PHSCGRAVDSVEIRIDSPNPQKIVGEIQARGLSIMTGYYKNPEATKASFTQDGWMNTGDLGIIDKNGNIFIKGRSKNMILSANGQNIYPEEIEAVFNNQDYVLETVVVSRGANLNLVALIYFDKDKLKADGIEGELFTQKLEEIRELVNQTMPVYSKISQIEVREEPFEKTPKMSIKRFLYS
ncbi:MAG: AMP-binding protein, partial [Bacteroidia bacterium]|nr:AMP-binding protein [Bacteroidia bacterium]